MINQDRSHSWRNYEEECDQNEIKSKQNLFDN